MIGHIVFDRSTDVDNGGLTFYTGEDGDDLWSPDARSAVIFHNRKDAERVIEECDPDEILRDRLVVVPVFDPNHRSKSEEPK